MPKKNSLYLFLLISVLSFIGAMMIGGRIVSQVWENPRPIPRQTNVNEIKNWMTMPYISRTYGVPLPEFEKVFQYDFQKNKHKNLSQIAKDLGKTPDQFISEMTGVILLFQSTHTQPSTPRP